MLLKLNQKLLNRREMSEKKFSFKFNCGQNLMRSPIKLTK